MIAPLLASFVGISLLFLLMTPYCRGILLSSGVFISALCKLCLGNVLLLTTDLWLVGLLILVSLIGDGLRYAHVKDNLSCSVSLLEMLTELNEPFDSMLALACGVVILIQMFVLLWWGVVFVYIISEVNAIQGIFIMIMLLIFLVWIVQFFHAIVAVIVEGCVLWLFIRPANRTYHRNDYVQQVTLYACCAATTSLGSICKAAVVVVPAQAILSAVSVLRWRLRSYGHQSRCITVLAPAALNILMNGPEPWARQYHRLSLAYVATYANTLHRAAEAVNSRHPEIVDMVTLDSTSFLLKMLCSWTAMVVSAALVAIASLETHELRSAWPLFFFQCYLLTYACISLALHTNRCAVDALFLAYADSPDEFAEKNSLLYHRFLRIRELDMD